MSLAMALEDVALGEVTLDEGAKTVATALSKLDEKMANTLYETLRSWVWKTLEARRRDEELTGWLDVLSRASSRIRSHAPELSTKLEGFMELIHASVMTAGAAAERSSLERKHVKEVLGRIYRSGGRIRRKTLMDALRLKAANLSRVMTPIQDDGLVVREIEGREIFYRLTMKGMDATLPLVAHVVEPRVERPLLKIDKALGGYTIKPWDKSLGRVLLNLCDQRTDRRLGESFWYDESQIGPIRSVEYEDQMLVSTLERLSR